MAMHDCIHIRAQFKNRGIDHSLAGNRTDPREFVEGMVEAYEPTFVSLFRGTEHLHRNAVVFRQPRTDVAPNVSDLPL